jgi:hypothetical protein
VAGIAASESGGERRDRGSRLPQASSPDRAAAVKHAATPGGIAAVRSCSDLLPDRDTTKGPDRVVGPLLGWRCLPPTRTPHTSLTCNVVPTRHAAMSPHADKAVAKRPWNLRHRINERHPHRPNRRLPRRHHSQIARDHE